MTPTTKPKTVKPPRKRQDDTERCVILVECYRAMLVALDLPLEPLPQSEQRARIWNEWLKPWNIPTKDLKPAFICGNALRQDRRTIGVRDVAAGYVELRRARSSKHMFEARDLSDGVQMKISQLYATAIRSGKLTLGQLDAQFKGAAEWLRIKSTIQSIITPGGITGQISQ